MVGRTLRTLLRGAMAVLVAAVLGSLLQTQFNLHALAGLGVPVAINVRLTTSALDLLRFAPLYAAIVAVGFLVAFPVATWLQRRLPRLRGLYPLAGGVAVLTALLLMRALLGLSPVAAAREPLGLAALALAGAAGGYAYAWLRGAA